MSSEVKMEKTMDNESNDEPQSDVATHDERHVDLDVEEPGDERVAEGGYGWVVVFARFLFFCLELGTAKSFGIFVPMIIVDLKTSTGLVGFAFGLVTGLTHLLGAIWMVLYTPNRLVLYFAATLSILGLVAITLCENEIMLVIFCAITGIGYSFFPVWTIIAIREYFSKRFPAAISLAAAGRAVGMGVFPIIAGFLTDIYGWRGSMLFVAGLNAHLFVVAMLTRTPGVRIKPNMSNMAGENFKRDDQIPRHGYCNDGDDDTADRGCHVAICKRINGCIKSFLDKTSLKSILCEYPVIKSYPVLILSSAVLSFGTVIFLVPSAIDKGIDLRRASVLSSIFGIGGLVSRASVGVVMTRTGWKPASVMCVIYPVCAASFAVHASSTVYVVLAINSFVVAACLGVLALNCVLLIEELLPKRLFRGGYILYLASYGMGAPIGGFIAGKYKDWTLSYDAAFYFFVALNIICLVVLLHSMWLSSSKRKQSEDRERLLTSN